MDTTKGKFTFFFWGILFFLLYFKVFAFAWNRWVYGSIIPFSLGIIGVVLLFSWNLYDDHREKGLDDLITYKASNFKALDFRFDWRTEENEPAEELMGFLSQYRVKKMKDSEWDSNVSGEKGFHFMIYSKGKPTGASIYENRVLSFNHTSYYKVLNGPIDMEWIDAFEEKYGPGEHRK